MSTIGLADEGIPNMHAKSIQYIIDRGYCICGTKLTEENLLKHILMEKEMLPPESIGTIIRSFRAVSRERISNVNGKIRSFDVSHANVWELIEEIEGFNREIEECEAILKGLKGEDIEKLKNRYDECKNLREVAHSKLVDTQSRLNGKKERLEEIKKEIVKCAERDNRNQKPLLCKSYADVLRVDIENTVKVKEQNIRKDFEERLQKVFTEIYTGERTVEVDENFDAQPIGKHGVKAKSPGLDVVLSFSYVAALIGMAKEEMKKKNEGELKTEPYPLVMDAPTSASDEDHIPNIFGHISTVAEQLILFVMNKDWHHAKSALSGKIDKVYQLVKESETYTHIEEVY
jgi:DNA sulfur modification protein DndD